MSHLRECGRLLHTADAYTSKIVPLFTATHTIITNIYSITPLMHYYAGCQVTNLQACKARLRNQMHLVGHCCACFLQQLQRHYTASWHAGMTLLCC
jgi:hypothetical protein